MKIKNENKAKINRHKKIFQQAKNSYQELTTTTTTTTTIF